MESYSKGRRGVIFKISLAFVFGALLIGLLETTLSLVQTSRTVASMGSVKGIGVGIYWNSACTNRTSSINWGLLEPGSNRSVIVYVRNEGNTASTLSKAAQNWNPTTAPSYMTLNWNYSGQTLSVNQVLPIKLTLVVLPSVTGISSFSFDITITATG
jgi:hypothetical protein